MTRREKIGLTVFFAGMILAVFYISYSYIVYKNMIESAKKYPNEMKNQIVDWKNYHNEKYGFSVSYPNNWKGAKEEETIIGSDNRYLFRLALGAEDGLSAGSMDGFYVFVFPNNVCIGSKASSGSKRIITDYRDIPGFIANQAQRADKCIDRKILVGGDVLPENVSVYQFIGANYDYLIVPFIDQKNKSSEKFKSEWTELVSSFNVDSPDHAKPDAKEVDYKKRRQPVHALWTLKNPAKIEEIYKPLPEPDSLLTSTTLIPYKKPALNPSASLHVPKMICPHPNRKPSYSKTKGKHMDEDCCPDPDEWPNPKCAYHQADYAVMKKGS